MKSILLILITGLVLITLTRYTQADQRPMGGIYDITVNTIDGQPKSLGDYKGKVLLIVNTASRCGFTPQYKGLETLYREYKDKGLEILGFPANNFMGQEPGSNKEIKKFCALKYNVTFPLFAKISVKGPDEHPLYQYLTNAPDFKGPISWNFNKFLVDMGGNVIARFDSKVDPQAPELVKEIEQALKQL